MALAPQVFTEQIAFVSAQGFGGGEAGTAGSWDGAV
jgi:hypothetical protein